MYWADGGGDQDFRGAPGADTQVRPYGGGERNSRRQGYPLGVEDAAFERDVEAEGACWVSGWAR